MTESPSALLERAAAHLEEASAHFAGYLEVRERIGSPQQWWAYDTLDRNASATAKRWVEMMSPPVAAPLVELLRDVARSMRTHRRSTPDDTTYCLETGPTSTYQHSALAIARAVLGEPSEEPS